MNDLQAAETTMSGRETVPAMETRLGKTIPVLDHGFIRVVDYMGSDAAVVQAARVSYGRGTKTVNEDRGLIRYLMRRRHSTPFEMCELKLHVKLPMFVARQWIRHRTANVNEYSARYSILDSEFYLPPADALAAQSKSNNQGRGAGRRRSRPRLSAAQSRRRSGLRPLSRSDEPGRRRRDGRSRPPGPCARAGADDAADELVHAVVLEG